VHVDHPKDGSVQRAIAIVVLRLHRSDLRLLVQLGKWNLHFESPLARCKYPGGKRKDGQDIADALTAILEGPLSFMVDHVVLTGAEMTVDMSHSKHFGIQTKYLKTTITASLDGQLTMPPGTLMQTAIPVMSQSATAFSGAAIQRSTSHSVHFPELEIFGIQDEKVLRMFAWVNCEDIDMLCTHAGEIALQKCLQELEFFDGARTPSERIPHRLTDTDVEQFPI